MLFSSCVNLFAGAEADPGTGAGDLGAPPLEPHPWERFLAINLRETFLVTIYVPGRL